MAANWLVEKKNSMAYVCTLIWNNVCNYTLHRDNCRLCHTDTLFQKDHTQHPYKRNSNVNHNCDRILRL